MAASKHGTLTADTVATVTIDGGFTRVAVLNRGSDEIYFNSGPKAATAGANLADPTVEGDGTNVVPGGGFAYVDGERGGTDFKLISGGTPAYSLVGERDD